MKTFTHWNYRVVKEDGELSIREVYYKGKKIEAWAAEPSIVWGVNLEEISQSLELMKLALSKPILHVDGYQILKRL